MRSQRNDSDTVRRGVTSEYDHEALSTPRKMPLLRSWSARSAEAREVLVRFQRVARCGRGRSVRHFVASKDQAGSNPVVRSMPAVNRAGTSPRSTKVVQQSRTLRASVRFRPRALRARSSAAERRFDMPEIAGSIPAARTTSCSASGPGSRSLTPSTRVRFPYTTPSDSVF